MSNVFGEIDKSSTIIESNIVNYTQNFSSSANGVSTIKIISGSQNTNYWKENLKYVGILLSVWFLVSFCFSILFKDFLDTFYLGGFKLGFWFAQQGSMYVFVIIIFIYVHLINKLDKKYGFNKKD